MKGNWPASLDTAIPTGLACAQVHSFLPFCLSVCLSVLVFGLFFVSVVLWESVLSLVFVSFLVSFCISCLLFVLLPFDLYLHGSVLFIFCLNFHLCLPTVSSPSISHFALNSCMMFSR
jgi:hypothetical protein